MRSASIALATTAVIGCVRITSDMKVIEIPDGTRHVRRVVKGSQDYDAKVRVDGVGLVVAISTKETCEEADIPIVRKKRVITRTEVPGSFGIASEYILGAAGIVLGALAIANPERCGSSDGGNTGMSETQGCVAFGWTLVAVGGVGLGVGFVDTIRLADGVEDLGRHEGTYEAAKHECNAGPLANKNIELRLGDGALRLQGKTSERGLVSFELLDVSAEILPTHESPGELSIDDNVVPLSMTEKQGHELAATLYENPLSRVSRNAFASAQKGCDAVIDQAQKRTVRADSDDAAVTEARDGWERAKSKCGALWTAGHQSRRDAAEKEIGENRVGAVVIALTAGNLDRIDELLATDKDLASRLRDDAGVLQLLRKIVGEPTRALTAGKGLAEAQRRLCRARQLFVKIRGAEKWNQFKLEVAQNVSELGGGVPSNIVRLMDAARCE